jgi:hypothetical protein
VSFVAAKQDEDAIGFEALTNEVSIEPLEFPIVGDTIAAAEPLVKGGRYQGIRIEGFEGLLNCPLCNGWSDTGCGEPLLHAELSAFLEAGFRVGDRFRGALVVKASVASEALDGCVNRVLVVAAAGQPLPDLTLGQLASAQHFERRYVGGIGHPRS